MLSLSCLNPFRTAPQTLSALLFILFLAPPAWGQLASANFGGSGQKTYKLTGTVVNSITGEPIPHALVGIYSRSALTDSSGRFEFVDLPEMQTTVVTRKPGFFSEQDLSRVHQNSNLFRVGPDAGPVTITLVPEAVIYGKVAANGEPVERVPILLYQSFIADGRRSWEQHQTFTDEEGEFRFAELRPGNYAISAGPSLDTSALVIAGPEFEFGFAKAYYSDATDFPEATSVHLIAGQQAEIDFSLKKSRAFNLSGTVVGNAPGAGVSLSFRDRSGQIFGFPVRFDPGAQQFHMRVPAGAYILHAQAQNQNGVPLSAELPLTIGADQSGVILTLEPMPSFPVNVHLEFARQEDTRSQRQPDRTSLPSRTAIPANIVLETTSDVINQRAYSAQQGGDDRAPMSFRNVEPGKYDFKVQAFGSWYVQSATSGGANLLSQELEVGGAGQTIDVVLRNDCASLNVTLGTESKPSPGAILVVRDDAPREIKALTVDGDGPFTMDGLAPGGYNVLAFDTIEQLEYSDPEVLGPYLSQAAHVNLQANQTVDVAVERIRQKR